MPFVQRFTDFPPLGQISELEQIVIIDRTPPSTSLGISAGAAALVGEFLKGPFIPLEVFSGSELVSIYGGVSALLSQTDAGVQDGSGFRFEGNGAVELRSRQFRRLVIERTDQDMTKTDGGLEKVFVRFDITVAAADKDPDDATITGKEILIPAGTRFADAPFATATKIIALSQDILIPKGSTITAGLITVSSLVGITLDLNQDENGVFTRTIDDTGAASGGPSGATAFFVKGTSAIIAEIDTILDSALPGITSTIAAAGISTVDSAGAATAVFAAGTAAATLVVKNESLYQGALDKTKPGNVPQDDITIIWAARNTSTIRTTVVANAVDSSQFGRGRVAVISSNRATGNSASNAVTAKTAAVTLANATDSDRGIVTFPYVKLFVPELDNRTITLSPGSFMASTLAMFPEEKNPGARNDFIRTLISDYEDCFRLNTLVRNDYVRFKSNGVAALINDRTNGWQFQSGITSNTSIAGREPIKRRRMADFIQASLAEIAVKYNKEPATTERIDAFIGDCSAFLSTLKSEDNTAQQRIVDYSLDPKSGNRADLLALGIFVLIVKVRLLASLDDIVLDSTIGEGVDVSVPQAA